MILQIVCLRDIVANVYHQPMFAHHLGGAIRSFGDACQNKPEGNQVGQHPEDYELYHCGEWNDATGEWKYLSEIDGNQTDFKQIAVGANYKQR